MIGSSASERAFQASQSPFTFRDYQEFRVGGHNGKKGDSPWPDAKPRIPDALLDQLLSGADAKTAFDQNGLLDN